MPLDSGTGQCAINNYVKRERHPHLAVLRQGDYNRNHKEACFLMASPLAKVCDSTYQEKAGFFMQTTRCQICYKIHQSLYYQKATDGRLSLITVCGKNIKYLPFVDNLSIPLVYSAKQQKIENRKRQLSIL